MKTVDDILVVEKMKSFSIPKNDFNYYLKLSNNTVILVTKEEFHLNRLGTELRLESEVEYK